MTPIEVYRRNGFADIRQLSVKRDWMDETPEKHAYHCFPISLTNRLGWGVYFPEDIVFVWDGITDTTPNHIRVLKGEKFCNLGRGNATLSFITGLTFITDENTSIITMPVPNEFNENAQCYTTTMSTSFYKPEFPIAWRIIKPNVEIIIEAGTPVATLVPMSISGLQNYEMNVYNRPVPIQHQREITSQYEKNKEKMKNGGFSHAYRRAENENGETLHETRSLNLKTNRMD